MNNRTPNPIQNPNQDQKPRPRPPRSMVTSWVQMSPPADVGSSGPRSGASFASATSVATTCSSSTTANTSSSAAEMSEPPSRGLVGAPPPPSVHSHSNRFGSSSSSSMTSSVGLHSLAGAAADPLETSAVAGSSNIGQQQQQLDPEQQLEQNRKLRLQVYVFVLRCISYPFNAKASDLQHRNSHEVKLSRAQLETIVGAHAKYTQSLLVALRNMRGQSDAAGRSGAGSHPHQQHSSEHQQQQPPPGERLFPHRQLKQLGQCSSSSQRQLDDLYVQFNARFQSRILQSPKMATFVESQCCSQQDLRDLLRLYMNLVFDEEPEASASLWMQLQAQGLARDAIVGSWLIRFEHVIRAPQSGDSGTSGSTSGGVVATNSNSGCPDQTGSGAELSATQSSGTQAFGAASFSKEQLYATFGAILSIKKFEHQLLFNALQLDSSDEQAAAIRRELDGRISRIAELERNKKLLPKFVLKEMEMLYLDELRSSVNKLMINLDSLPVINQQQSHQPHQASKSGASGSVASSGVLASAAPESRGPVSYGLQKFRRYNRTQASLTRDGLIESHPSETTLTKLDVLLTFHIEVIVMEVRGLRQISPNREIYCTMEIEGSEKLQTEHVQARKPLWDTQGDFTTNHPLPVLKIKLYAVNQSVLSLEDKELAKLVLRPTVLSPKTPEWCAMVPSAQSADAKQQQQLGASGSDHTSGSSSSSTSLMGGGGASGSGLTGSSPDPQGKNANELKIRVIVRMDRPQQLKHCGYLYGIGKTCWLKMKRRYHILIQVSQYTFVMCSYRDKKAKPTEMLNLEGYTVDYIEPPTDLIMEHCAEIASANADHHHGSSSNHHGSGGTFGLAGRLANVILKQPSAALSAAAGADSDGPSGANSNPSGLGADLDGEPQSAIQSAAAVSDELHSKFYFNVVKEGDSVVFACDDEQECFGWVMALYRATGQAHKPTPIREHNSAGSSHYIDVAFAYQSSQASKLVGTSSTSSSSFISQLSSKSSLGGLNGGASRGKLGGVSLRRSPATGDCKSTVDVANQRARKHGMDEFISADPIKFQHNHLFAYLQNETLRHRLEAEQHCSMGWFSSGQVYVLDEYCARYGVRTCFRHLAYLNSLLDLNLQRGFFIDHTLLNYGYDFCASHVSGQAGQAHPIGTVNFDLRSDGVGTVTCEERDMFQSVRQKLLRMIELQISDYAHAFPFGRPEGALKAALSLLERVLIKEQQTNPTSQNEELRNLIRRCLERAATSNYRELVTRANLLEPLGPSAAAMLPPAGSASLGASPVTGAGTMSPSPTPPLSSNVSSGSLVSSSTAATGATSGVNLALLEASQASSATLGDVGQGAPRQCLTFAQVSASDQLKSKDKLRLFIKLAELCCEQQEENNRYFGDAFAWHSDLMMDHFELFWSLFGQDMDRVLAELGLQGPGAGGSGTGNAHRVADQAPPPGATSQFVLANLRDAFLLFQILNNHLRRDSNLDCKRFKAYLCETFKAKLLRYIDINEGLLTRMLAKASEKDSQLSHEIIEQMYAKLDELQRFVLQHIRWPEEQLAEQLHQRLKLIAYELCEASMQKTLAAFQRLDSKQSKWTTTATNNFACPTEMIQMIDLALETRRRSQTLCTFNMFDQMSYHSKIDQQVDSALAEMQSGLMSKMLNALESTLTKLARYDEGNLLAPILSLTYKQGISVSGRDIGKQYVGFVFNCCDTLRHKINDELWIVNLLEEWYSAQMNIMCSWLAERIDRNLHDVQLVALNHIVPKVYTDMSLQGVPEEQLNIKSYQTIMSRLKMEEASMETLGSGANNSNSDSTQTSGGLFGSSLLSSFQTSAQPTTTSNMGGTTSSQSAMSSQAPAATGSLSQASYSSMSSSSSNSRSQTVISGRVSEAIQARRGPNLGSSQPSSAFMTTGSSGAFHTTTGAQSQAAAGDSGASEGDNFRVADRALQSATRMFKGFFANNSNN